MTDVATLRMTADSAGILTGDKALLKIGQTAAATEAKVHAATTSMTRGMRGVAGPSLSAAGGVRNLGLQLNQIAQVGGMTGNWMSAIAVQLPDILLGFGTLGIFAGVAAGAMIPFLSTLAGGASEAEKLSDAMDALGEAMDRLDAATDSANRTFIDLRGEYGQNAVVAEKILNIQRQLALVESERALSGAIGSIATQYGSLEVVIDDTGATIRDGFLEVVRELQGQMGLSAREAQILAMQFRSLGEAQGPEEIAAAMENVREQFVLASGGVANMTEEQRSLLQSILDGEAASLRLSAIDYATNIGRGADEAQRMADELSRANRASSLTYSGRGGDPRTANGRSGQFVYTGPRLDENNNPITRSGGAPRVSAEERAAERIFEQTRTALEKYNAEVAELNSLRAAGLIDAETHNRAVEMAGEKYADMSEDVDKATRSMSGSFALATASIVTGADSAGEAVARLIEQMIAIPLLERGFQSILGGIGGNLGFSFGGFRAAGGPVAAGTSYMVGEKGPELFTPGSSGAITANNQLGQNVHVTVGVDPATGNLTAFVDRRAAGAVVAGAPSIMAAQDRRTPQNIEAYTARRG